MLEERAYDKWRRQLKETIFSGMHVHPHTILKKVFGISQKIDCIQFFLIGTNTTKKIEVLWGKFFIIPSHRDLKKHVVIFESSKDLNFSFTGVVEFSQKNNHIVIRSLLDKDDIFIMEEMGSEKYPGTISSKTREVSQKISREHWAVIKRYFKEINVNI